MRAYTSAFTYPTDSNLLGLRFYVSSFYVQPVLFVCQDLVLSKLSGGIFSIFVSLPGQIHMRLHFIK